MRRVVIALATAGLLAAGIVTAPLAQAAPTGPSATPDFQPAPVTWGPCTTNNTLKARGAECGFVEVPLDYANPKGTKIQLAVSRLKHTTTDFQGVMLVNPGGPGGSGLIYSVLRDSATLNGAGKSYDWIGFDPRGVGSSKPALSCIPDYAGYNRPYYIPDNPKDEAAWLKKSASYSAACAVKGRDLLPHLTTADSAKDMDSIRKALGQEQINYYGFSYGTYLGSVYATLFPQNLRRAVFDGVVDPRGVWEQDNYDQDIAFERNIKIYFEWVAKYDSIYHLGTTEAAVEKQYYDQYQALRTTPAGGKIGSSEWNDIFLQAGYYVYGWEDIATAFSSWVNHKNADGLIALYGGPPFNDNGYAMYLGVQCVDATWSSYPQFRQKNVQVYKKAPFETWSNAWFNAPCTFWPAKAGTPVKIDGSKAPPILLVSETLDAATPYSGALEIRKQFPKSSLLEGVGGTTHAGTFGDSDCENAVVASYIATGALPKRVAGNGKSDAQCDPNPQPVPTAPATAASMAATGSGAAAQAVPGSGTKALTR